MFTLTLNREAAVVLLHCLDCGESSPIYGGIQQLIQTNIEMIRKELIGQLVTNFLEKEASKSDSSQVTNAGQVQGKVWDKYVILSNRMYRSFASAGQARNNLADPNLLNSSEWKNLPVGGVMKKRLGDAYNQLFSVDESAGG